MFQNLLQNKNVLVTGGSRGLGRQIAESAKSHGGQVAVLSRSKSPDMEGIYSIEGDVTSSKSIDKAFNDLIDKWGHIDLLVNNAGISEGLPFALISEEDWNNMIETNLTASFKSTHGMARHMIKRKSGCIINISSLAAHRSMEAPVHYASSKSGLFGLTNTLAKELGRYNVRILNVAPGILDEGVSRNIPKQKISEYIQRVALGRVGTTKEVAELVCFLASDFASYITGTTIAADGGV